MIFNHIDGKTNDFRKISGVLILVAKSLRKAGLSQSWSKIIGTKSGNTRVHWLIWSAQNQELYL